MKKTLTPAEKLSNLFDNDWKTSRSNLRSGNFPFSSTPKTQSSRIDQKEVVTQESKPIALIGSTVVYLEKNTDGLSGINVQQAPTTLASIPLTVEQDTLQMKPNLNRFSIPLCENAKKENKIIIENEQSTFENMQIKPPKFIQVEEPIYYKECGPQLDQKLLNPFQRREILEFEKKKNAADAYIRKAVSDRSKLKEKLVGPDYKRGVVGYDNSINPESEIYGEKAKSYLEDKNNQQIFNENRRSYIAQKTSSIQHSGNILNPDLMSDQIKTEKYYQNKGGNIHALSFEETYFRVLESNKEVSRNNPQRTQNLRNQDLNGKKYNIVSHVPIEVWPSTSSERVYKNLLHPSQTSLYGSRNMQGATRPF